MPWEIIRFLLLIHKKNVFWSNFRIDCQSGYWKLVRRARISIYSPTPCAIKLFFMWIFIFPPLVYWIFGRLRSRFAICTIATQKLHTLSFCSCCVYMFGLCWDIMRMSGWVCMLKVLLFCKYNNVVYRCKANEILEIVLWLKHTDTNTHSTENPYMKLLPINQVQSVFDFNIVDKSTI